MPDIIIKWFDRVARVCLAAFAGMLVGTLVLPPFAWHELGALVYAPLCLWAALHRDI